MRTRGFKCCMETWTANSVCSAKTELAFALPYGRVDGYQSFSISLQCSQVLPSLDAGDATRTWAPCMLREEQWQEPGARNMQHIRLKDTEGGQHCHHLSAPYMPLHAAQRVTRPLTSSGWWQLEEAAAPYLISWSAVSPAAHEIGFPS